MQARQNMERQHLARRLNMSVLMWAVCAGLPFVIGCATPLRKVQPAVSPDTLGDAVFVHYLAATAVVTFDEGARGVLLVLEDTAASSGAEGRREALERRGMVSPHWGLQANSVLDRGTFAFMLCRGLDVPQSFNEWVAGWTGVGQRRAALATAYYEGLLEYGPAHEPIAGGEVADALVRAEHWLDKPQTNVAETP